MTYQYAEAGEKVELKVAGRESSPHGPYYLFDVAAPCASARPGHWACVCGDPITNNMGLSSHRGEGHRLVWICHEHGPEAVPEGER